MELYLLWHIELKTKDRTGIYFTSGMDLGLGFYFLFWSKGSAYVVLNGSLGYKDQCEY